MNILMLNYEFPPIGGGASPVSYDIGKGLRQMGHRVTVVTMAYKGLPHHENMDGMEVYRVKCLRTEKMVCHPWEQATYILSAYRFIRNKLDVGQYDICYTHFIIPTGVVAWRLRRSYKLPYVITAHGSDVLGHNNKRFKLLYTLLRKPWGRIVRDAACVVSPSRYLLELMKRSEAGGKYKLIQNGVDTAVFCRSGQKQKKILVMCRLQETKNVQCIIRALGKVESDGWTVDILGDGPYKETLQSMVSESHLGSKIFFRGWVANKSQEHLKTLKETSIFLSASRVENCPTSILEAVSCGARVLLSDIPAHRQLMGKTDESVFFPADDDEALAGKLQRLIDETEDRGILSNAYDCAPFDWKRSIQQYERVLQDIRV